MQKLGYMYILKTLKYLNVYYFYETWFITDCWHFHEILFIRCSQDIIRSLWNRIRRDEPELQGNFEEFLCRVTGEIKRSHLDLNNLETALRT